MPLASVLANGYLLGEQRQRARCPGGSRKSSASRNQHRAPRHTEPTRGDRPTPERRQPRGSRGRPRETHRAADSGTDCWGRYSRSQPQPHPHRQSQPSA